MALQPLRSRQHFEQRFHFFQIGSAEAFGEPAVDGDEKGKGAILNGPSHRAPTRLYWARHPGKRRPLGSGLERLGLPARAGS